ncbi:MAG: type II toxin-antitoxin system RelE/ParE family toxin [Oscillospiraceae bacterium]|jgi:mRNA interferase RelE/StbE|nr:type II toxin-antitoxin system RelE/ParE family toxin [Oscillospiraceae bacterium]
MNWEIIYLPEADEDLLKLDNSLRKRVKKTIINAQDKPLPISEGGKGKPLGNKFNINLTSLLELKLRGIGIRVVYKLEKVENIMKIIVIGARADEEVFIEAKKRIDKYNL